MPGLQVYLFWILFLCLTSITHAQNIILDVGQEKPEPRWLILPYVFHTESLQTAYGIAGGTSGYLQPQMGSFAAIMGTTNSSAAAFLAISDYQLPFLKRGFIDFKGSAGYYTDSRVYAGFNSDFPGERGGSNNSSNDNFIQGEDSDSWFDLKLKYLLPTGQGKNTTINTYTLADGLLVQGATGGDSWNPMTSGRLNLEVMAFYRDREFKTMTDELAGKTNGLEFALEYDNRDFYANPSRGSLQRLVFSRDFGWFESTDSWSVIEADLRKYLSLGATGTFRQRVLALDFWTAYSPTWQVIQTPNGPEIDGRPPIYQGASLGGFDRLRAYPQYRYSDKAAIYYAAELRLIPKWNPLGDMKLLKFLDIDWWQFVPFVEVGRVAPNWSLSELNSDMKWDVGLGLRFMAQKAVFRIDTAVTDDAWSTWAMVSQPF
jgi:hypothetical protein